MALSAIKQMEELANSLPDVISLSQGIPSSPSANIIRESVIQEINNNNVDRYSCVAGIMKLRECISLKLNEQGMDYNAEDEIVVTAGAMQAISATIFALTNPGDEIIVLSPTYSYYRRIGKLASVNVKTLVLKESENWKLDIVALQKLVTNKTKLLVICNPNNPTGSVLSQTELQSVGMLAQKCGFVILSDEVYQSFYYGPGKISNISIYKSFKKNIVSIMSLSKDYSLTGWRVGYLYSDKAVVNKILQVHDVLINCAPVVSQYAALAGLIHSEKILSESLTKYAKHRVIMGSLLEKMSEHLEFQWPIGSYYFFPKIKGLLNSVKFCTDLLYNSKLSVVPGSEFGQGGEGHIRLCFGKSEQEITEGMDRLRKYFLYNTYVTI